MKKQLIAAAVGGLIIFLWQFLSWSALNVHGAEMKYTQNQDEILSFLSENLQEGQYFLPTVPPDLPRSEHQAVMENAMGKPWARISYHEKMETNMAVNMIRGFAIDFLSVLLLIWILLKFADLNISSAVIASLSVGAIGYFTFPYLNSIWFEGSTLGYILDTIVQWGLVGVWLGWYLRK